ncbi:toll/interleukin-1 receptor domain-containing protein [Rhizobium pisi]|uniref:toll/interleukin-1 receptor domain-containing protein n=1 Tax=Rhizobium TaxID=379 RepID=UPI003CFDF865
MGKVNLWQRILGRVFGYDFFVSYSWDDGGVYAAELANRLRSFGFQVFFDRNDFTPGMNWVTIGDWSLRRTSQLVLIGTATVLRSSPVLREVTTFGRTGRRIIPIDVDGYLEPEKINVSKLAPFLPPELLRIRETAAGSANGPSDETVNAIVRSFDSVRQDVRRGLIFAVIAISLAILTATAIWFWQSARVERDAATANLISAQAKLEFEDARNTLPLSVKLAREAAWRLLDHERSNSEAFGVLLAGTRLLPDAEIDQLELPAPVAQVLQRTEFGDLLLRLENRALCSASHSVRNLYCIDTSRTNTHIAQIPRSAAFAVSDESGKLCMYFANPDTAPRFLHCEENLPMEFGSDPGQETTAWFILDNGRMIAYSDDRICSWKIDESAALSAQTCQLFSALDAVVPYKDNSILVMRNNRACVYEVIEEGIVPSIEAPTFCIPVIGRIVGVSAGYFVASADDGHVSIIDLASLKSQEYAIPFVAQVALSHDLHVAAIRQMPQASVRNEVLLVDLTTGQERGRLRHDGRINAVEMLPGRPYIVTRSGASYPSDGTVSLWDVRTGREVTRFAVEGPVVALAILPGDSGRIAIAVNPEGATKPKLELWPFRRSEHEILPIQKRVVSSRVFTFQDGSVVLVGERERSCAYRVGDTGTPRCVTHTDTPVRLTLQGAERILSISTQETGQRLCSASISVGAAAALECPLNAPTEVEALSHNGRWLARRANEQVCIRTTDTKDQSQEKCLPGTARARLVTDDGRLLLTDRNPDGEVIYDIDKSRAILRIPAFQGDWEFTEFTTDNRYVALANSEGDYNSTVVRVYDTTYGTEVSQTTLPGRVLSMSFGSDDILAIGVEQGGAYLWNWRKNTMVARMSLGYPVQALSFDKNGRLLTVAGSRTQPYTELQRWSASYQALFSDSCGKLPESLESSELERYGIFDAPRFVCSKGSGFDEQGSAF